jgi:hypothetical protein
MFWQFKNCDLSRDAAELHDRGIARLTRPGGNRSSGPLDPLHVYRALGEEGGQRPDRRKHRREHRANDADGQRKLSQHPVLLTNTDPPDIAGLDQFLDRLHELVTSELNGLPESSLSHK